MAKSAQEKVTAQSSAVDENLKSPLKLQTIDIVGPMTIGVLLFCALEEANFYEFLIFSKFLLLSILWPSFRRTCYVWFASVLVLTPKLIFQWCDHEDHIYFSTYWCGSLALATMAWRGTAPDAELVMRKTARLLLGLCFLFAFFWKITSPQFFQGSLFHHKLVADVRFAETLARFPGGLDQETLRLNKVNLDNLSSSLSDRTTAQLVYSTQYSMVAHGMTWWTIFIEGLLGIGFLLPAGVRMRCIRNASLIGFSLSTYVVAPVMGFGFTFMAMGYANCEERERRSRICYLVAGAILFLVLCFRDEVLAILA